ncbi:MAG TPA: tetratricopeptide repeat protein, partial [Chromatiales bacterium]|nr:tetratricopeptide repeat protein [Chromatiales bacterium]
LASRTLLALPDLPLMVARLHVGGLDFEELAFRAEEIQALALQNHHLVMSESAARELVRETEGWITGLLLSTQTVWHGMADRVRVARASGVGLYDYLAQQVLDQQPNGVRDFLLRSSLLEEFDAVRCGQVLGTGTDWQQMIDTILRNVLFVLPVDNGGTWLRYHHLFRDFLQARMAQDHPDETRRILARLASIYSDQGQWESAHKIYRQLGDAEATADLIERAGTPMVKSGRLILLAEWVDQLPPEILDSHPGLLSVRGDVAVMLGDVARGLAWLNQAADALRACGDEPRLARTLVRRAVAHRFLGQYQASLDDADEAGALAENGGEGMQAVQAGAWQARGTGLYYMGRLEAAIEWLHRSLAAHSALGNQQSTALLLNDLGLAYMSAGRIALALDHYQRALDYWQRDGNLFRQATTLNNLGVLYHLRGEYEQALTFLERAHQAAEQSNYPRMGSIALAGIGDLFADLEASGAARDAYGQARQIAQKLQDRHQLTYLALAEIALARAEGDQPRARRLLETAGDLIEGSGSSYERGLW